MSIHPLAYSPLVIGKNAGSAQISTARLVFTVSRRNHRTNGTSLARTRERKGGYNLGCLHILSHRLFNDYQTITEMRLLVIRQTPISTRFRKPIRQRLMKTEESLLFG